MSFITKLALRLTRFSERCIPSAFVIACVLTLLAFVLAMTLAGSSFSDCLGYWGDGFWSLLEFGMQICLIMVTGSIIADSPLVQKGLDALAVVPRTSRQAVCFLAFLSMVLCWIHWGFGMIASAFLVRSFVKKHPKTDYRLLVAVAYFGMGAIWHAGPSGSAPLLVATPKHFLQDKIGLIPLSETIFSPFNLVLVMVMVTSLVGLAYVLYPAHQKDVFEIPRTALQELEPPGEVLSKPFPTPWLRWVESSYAVPVFLGGLGILWLVRDFSVHGLSLTLNKMNFMFLVGAILLHPHPTSFMRASEKAAGYVHGVIVQFPLYAGIYGIIKGAGLDHILADFFVRMATPKTFPLIVYGYSGILNYFIPSGGSKWAVEAPYVLEAARNLHVPFSKTVLAYAWGDMVTDMIQPFWCIPLLAIAKLEFKDILGYEMVTFFLCALIGSLAFLLF